MSAAMSHTSSVTRTECPEVVGSRWSIAVTAALMNPAKRFSMSW